MKILVLGASGATGCELVTQGLAAGHEVTAFARDRARMRALGGPLRMVEGDATDRVIVESAIRGQDAVLSALGAPTPMRPYPPFVEGVRNIVAAMEAEGVRRLIYLSFIGVPESREQFGFLGAHLIAPRILKHPTADHARNEDTIRRSSVDWTIVRAAKLTDGRKTSSYRIGERLEPKGILSTILPTIARADVAEAMLKQLRDRTFVRRAVSVMR